MLARRGAHQSLLEFGQHPSLAEHDRDVLALAAGELHAVDFPQEVDGDLVAEGRRTRSAGEYFICCLRRRSIMASMSLSATSAVMRSSSSDSIGCRATSGKTSKVATYLRSWPSSMLCGSMRGLPAGESWFSVTASAKLDCSNSPITSRCTCVPNCRRITVRGALPGRKPLRRAVRLRFFKRAAISWLTRSAGTCTCMRRSNLLILSTETCMSILVV